ncbi:hypothetical protein FIBSPDRAFT_938393 [Athelia psychrophila]|uniref:Uncharacterized protein n=1 Tax=Athelia psychrophila TaxID=1759441 RepID=A0A165YJS8_9AGAM|nr:hypothetical protein FIBSPDRAFT_938393 [Fibularhizoctonia sp. CBS 109695]
MSKMIISRPIATESLYMLGSFAVGSRRPETWFVPPKVESACKLVISAPIATEDIPLLLESFAASSETWLDRPIFQTKLRQPAQRKSFGLRCFQQTRIGKKGKGLVATCPTPLSSNCVQGSFPASSTDTLVTGPYVPPTPPKLSFTAVVTKAIQRVIDPEALLADESFFTDVSQSGHPSEQGTCIITSRTSRTDCESKLMKSALPSGICFGPFMFWICTAGKSKLSNHLARVAEYTTAWNAQI